jgi:predicted transcriptional regulator
MADDMSRRTYPNSDIPLPTDAELEILQVAWAEHKCTVGSVHYQLNKLRERGYTTVLKLMQIMLGKGLLVRHVDGHVHLYSPAVTEVQTRAALVGELVDKLFSGSPAALASFAIGLVPQAETQRRSSAILNSAEE